MKFLILLFYILFFPVFIFLTTILYTSDITPLLKTDLVKNHIYNQISEQLDNMDTGDSNAGVLNQFLQNKFTSDYLQQKAEKAMNDSDDWIRGKTDTPPVLSFKDVKDDLNAQYPQLLPAIEQASQEVKQQEAQNPDTAQQNPQASQNLDMINSLAKSDFTIPLSKYLGGLRNFYSTIRIVEPILGILLALSLVLLGIINKTWPGRLKWIGFALFFSSIWGFILAYGNVALVTFFAKYTATITNHTLQMATPILLQLIRHYVDAFTANQKIASSISLCLALGCFIGFFITRNNKTAQVKAKPVKKK